MEKSMVHQLNFLASSNVHFSRASFIHTSQEPDYGQLRKSRIQNLPNYKRQDLSGKLNFVVVFQGIEIERLSIQVQTLRMKNKDYERQIGNYQNYEVQIRQLTQKCHSYQIQRQDHQEAMQKMHRICQQLYNELQQMKNRYADIDTTLKEKYRLEKQRNESLSSQIQKWKARYHAAQNSKFKQLEDMRMTLECQRKSMLQRQIRQITIKHQSERSMLQGELRKLREYMQGRNAQINRLQINLSQSQIREGQLRQYQGRLEEYEDKLMMMAQQNLRLNELLRMKKQQIQNLKQNQRGLCDKISSFKRIQDQFYQVNRRIQNYQTEIKDWSHKYSRLQVQNNKNIILSQKTNQYERLLDNSAEEMERMNTIIRQKLSEIQRWKSQNQRMSIQLQQSKRVETKISQYQEKVCSISMENQRLSELLKSRLGQIEQWKVKFNEVSSKITYLSQSQIKAKQFESRLANQVNGKNQLMQRISRYQIDIKKLSESQNKLSQEISVNQQLLRQIQRLNISIRTISTQNSDFKKKYSILQSQIKQNYGIINELNQYKKKIVFMTQEIDRINGVIHEKTQQIRQLKQNYKNVNINANRYRTIEEQLINNIKQTQTLVLKLDQSRRQNECAQQKILGLQSSYSRLQMQALAANDQRQKLVAQINLKKVQIGQYLSRIESTDMKIRQLQIIQGQFLTLQKNMEVSQKKYKDIQSRYSFEVKRGETLSGQIQALSNQIMKVRAESNFSKQFVSQYTTLKTQSSEKDKQIAYLMQRIISIEKIIVLLKQQNIKTYNNMCVNHQKWMSAGQTLDSLTVFMDKMFDMSTKIQNLSEQNLQLESSVRLMNVEMVQSSYPVFQKNRQNIQPQGNTTKIASETDLIIITEPNGSKNNNYYQYENIQSKNMQTGGSQATSSYAPSQYSYTSSYLSNIQSTRPQSMITVKTISPITHETTTYSYANNAQNSSQEGEKVHYNYHVSTVSNGQRATLSKGQKYSSQINTSPQVIGRQSQGRRFVLSPVRFLN